MPLRPFDTVGLAALRALLVSGTVPAAGRGLILVMGKGGVGKTIDPGLGQSAASHGRPRCAVRQRTNERRPQFGGACRACRVPGLPGPCSPTAHERFPLTPAPPAVPQLRVLVIDDSVDNAEALCALLGLMGCLTAMAASGAEGLKTAAAFAPHLAFIDFEMPLMGGCEVARRLRASPPSAGMRLVCLTGRGQARDRWTCLSAGFDDFFIKPIAPESLHLIVAASTAALQEGSAP